MTAEAHLVPTQHKNISLTVEKVKEDGVSYIVFGYIVKTTFIDGSQNKYKLTKTVSIPFINRELLIKAIQDLPEDE